MASSVGKGKKELTFGEKKEEYYALAGKSIPVMKTPKYEQAKKTAIEMIESDKYGLTEADFWILMNATKNKDKMLYTSLIISHNGCLKINDKLEDKFKPECVTKENDGYNDSLVYTYNCKEQGLYEVGEVSRGNCKNDYPYAMALKRLFDRVVLKLSKLAYNGIMSDSESEEFSQQITASEDKPKNESKEKIEDVIDDIFNETEKAKDPITDETKNAINNSIKSYSLVMGITNKEIVSMMEEKIGKKTTDFTETDGLKACQVLYELIKEFHDRKENA